jgi:tetratricopeptide (TPR) repeat protein
VGGRRAARTRAVGVWRGAVVAAMALFAAACGGKPVVTAPATPLYPGFEFPAVASEMAVAPEVVEQHQRAWNLLQSGQGRAAAKAFATLAARQPAFFPAKAGLGYSELAERDYLAAASAFEATLAQAPTYLPALAGRAESLVAANRPVEAVAALEALVKADPSRAAARTQLETLRLRSIETLVEEGRQARQRGDYDRARDAWLRALQAAPDSAFMYRELAASERLGGRLDAAREHVLAALKLDDRDTAAHSLLGEIEAARGDRAAALAAYNRARELDPRGDHAARIATLEREMALAALPEAYRNVATSPVVTRGDLAALLGVALESWLGAGAGASAPLMTDTRSHWAQRWILAVTAAGLMEVYPNHTFQPGSVVRRVDLADTVRRAIEGLEARNPAASAKLRGTPSTFADLPETHAAYGAASLAVGSGLMQADSGQLFAPARPVTGAEAVATVNRLAGALMRP